jgi:hypothetical protein
LVFYLTLLEALRVVQFKAVEVARTHYDFGSSNGKKHPASPHGSAQHPFVSEEAAYQAQAAQPLSLLKNAVEVLCECSPELLQTEYLKNSAKEHRFLQDFDCDFSAFLSTNPVAPGNSWR